MRGQAECPPPIPPRPKLCRGSGEPSGAHGEASSPSPGFLTAPPQGDEQAGGQQVPDADQHPEGEAPARGTFPDASLGTTLGTLGGCEVKPVLSPWGWLPGAGLVFYRVHLPCPGLFWLFP